MFFQRLFSLVLLLSLLTGCASPDTAPAADVILWTAQGVEESAARSAAEVYAAKRGVQVRVEGFSQEAYLDRASAGLLAGLAEPDLLLLPAELAGILGRVPCPAPAGADRRSPGWDRGWRRWR